MRKHSDRAREDEAASVPLLRSGSPAQRGSSPTKPYLSLALCETADPAVLSSREWTPRSGTNARGCSPPHRTIPMSAPIAPGPLHLKQEVKRPLVPVAKVELDPRDISTKFLAKFGSKDIDWSRVLRCTATPALAAPGMTEAEVFHATVEIAAPPSPARHRSGGGGGGGGSKVISTPLALVKGILGSRGSSPRALERTNSFISASATATTSGGAGLNPDDAACSASRILSRSATDDLASDGASSSELGWAGRPQPSLLLPPPHGFVLKQYDTSVVDTPSMALRLMRHLTNTTSEKLLHHEVFFYTKLAPFLRDRSMFRAPKLYFAATLDRGHPGFLKYVCCRSGSGTVATLGLEDMSRAGFVFSRPADEGLFDEDCITSVLVSLAELHSAFWGRCSEPLFTACEPATIPRCVHRCGNSLIEKLSNFRAINLHTTVFRRWRKYPPMRLLNCEEVQHTLVAIQRRWREIREKAVQVVMRCDTVVHGDCHFRNVGFRRELDRDRRHRRLASLGGEDFQRILRQVMSSDTVDSLMGQGEGDTSAIPRTPTSPLVAPDPANLVQTCFLDFQSAGPGSAVVELVYFICTSIPVEVSWVEVEAQVSLLHGMAGGSANSASAGSARSDDGGSGKQLHSSSGADGSSVSNVSFSRVRHRFGPSSSPFTSQVESTADASSRSAPPVLEPPPNVAHRTNSTSPPPKPLSGPFTSESDGCPESGSSGRLLQPPTAAPPGPIVTHHTSATAMCFRELYEYDVGLLHQYYLALDASVQRALSFEQLVSEVFALVKHWAGTIVIDMINGSVEERMSQKKHLHLAKLLEASELTAQRVIWMATAAYVYELEERCSGASGASGASGGGGGSGSDCAGDSGITAIA